MAQLDSEGSNRRHLFVYAIYDDHPKMLIIIISYTYDNIKTGNLPAWANFSSS